ncbi:DNA-binding protein [Stagonosporopsis vannaccii]|nr:DNA-binding protein [Stagonosporopsis vannaccii]
MAFTGRTPESLIPRSDSRNPATTCKGITKSGRPCRRPIDARMSNDEGILAVVSVAGDSDGENIGAAAYFCWQHKDQAEQLAATKTNGPDTHLYPLKERSSIDTLVQRLGVLEVDDSVRKPRQKRRIDIKQEIRRIHRPPTWDRVEGPLISVPSDLMTGQRKRKDGQSTILLPRRKKLGFWGLLCCGAADDEIEVVRHKRRAGHHTDNVSTINSQQPIKTHRPSLNSQQMPNRRPASTSSKDKSNTAKMLRYIPMDVSPQLASTLLTEMSKPISPHDDEGYIYIFWLTPETSGPAPASTASTLLTPLSQNAQARRTSDVLRQYSVKQSPRPQEDSTETRTDATIGDNQKEKSTILLKIGRANNVHRRMNEWTRQCGYSLSLVRFYPYVSSSTPTPSQNVSQSQRESNAGAVRKVPTVMRVERMIHLELGGQRVMKKCDACGKQHQEWFEVEATENGVKKVDRIIKRWVEWAEQANKDRDRLC